MLRPLLSSSLFRCHSSGWREERIRRIKNGCMVSWTWTMNAHSFSSSATASASEHPQWLIFCIYVTPIVIYVQMKLKIMYRAFITFYFLCSLSIFYHFFPLSLSRTSFRFLMQTKIVNCDSCLLYLVWCRFSGFFSSVCLFFIYSLLWFYSIFNSFVRSVNLGVYVCGFSNYVMFNFGALTVQHHTVWIQCT